jgi:hypothetical protein
LIGDISVCFVLVQELQLELGIPDQVVQLVLFGFEISLKKKDDNISKGKLAYQKDLIK